MNNKKSWLDKGQQKLGQYAKDTSSQAGQFLGDLASQAQKFGGEVTSQIGQVISEKTQPAAISKQQTIIDLSQVDEEIRLCFYGALFAIGNYSRNDRNLSSCLYDAAALLGIWRGKN